MNGPLQSIRRVIRDYSAEFGVSLGDMLRDAMLGFLVCLVLLIDTVLFLAGTGS